MSNNNFIVNNSSKLSIISFFMFIFNIKIQYLDKVINVCNKVSCNKM